MFLTNMTEMSASLENITSAPRTSRCGDSTATRQPLSAQCFSIMFQLAESRKSGPFPELNWNPNAMVHSLKISFVKLCMDSALNLANWLGSTLLGGLDTEWLLTWHGTWNKAWEGAWSFVSCCTFFILRRIWHWLRQAFEALAALQLCSFATDLS